MSRYPIGGMPPSVRPEGSSCLPRLLIVLVVLGGLGWGAYVLLPKLDIDLPFGLNSSARQTRVAAEARAVGAEPIIVFPQATARSGGSASADVELMSDDPLPTDDVNADEYADVLVHAWGDSRSSEQLLLLSGKDGTPLWAVPEPALNDRFAVAGATVLAFDDTSMQALSLRDGQSLWTIQLSDTIIGYPQPQVWSFGANLVVHTVDNTLTLYSAASGEQLAQRVLDAPNPDTMVRMGEFLCDTEDDPDSTDIVRCYGADLSDGPVITLGATWSDSAAWWPDPVAQDGSGFRFLSDADPPRMEYFAADGTTTWQQPLDEAFSTIIPDSILVALGPQRAALADDDALALVTSSQTHLINLPEMQIVPLGFAGDTALVGGVRQRGTHRISVTAYDVNTGAQLWQVADVGVAENSVWEEGNAWAVTRQGGLLLALEQGADEKETVLLITPDGQPGWTITRSAFISSLPSIFLLNNRALLSFSESLQMVDATTGTVIWQYDRP